MSTPIFLAGDRCELADIDAQLAELNALVQGLEAKRKVVWDRLQSYTYPILTLPNEVVSEIFVHFLPAYPLCPLLSGPYSPTTLTHICHHWREVALATLHLWRAIDLEESDDSDAPIIAPWLGRSGQLPLSIQRDDLYEMGPETLDTILPFRAQWQYVLLYLPSSRLETVSRPMPLLRHMEIRLPQLRPPHIQSLSFKEVPQLRSATIWDFDCPMGLLPWTQLTALTLTCKAPSECTPILQLAVHLEYCELILYGEGHREPDIKLPLLKSLVLGQYMEEDEEGLGTGYLQCFVAPALRTLRVLHLVLNPAPISTLQSFIKKSGCKLDSLCITGTLNSQCPKEVYLAAFPTMDVSFAPEAKEWSDPNEKAQSRRRMVDFKRN